MAATTTKFLDYAGLDHLLSKFKTRQFNGMGLSTEDFSTDLKTKLEALQTKLGTFDPNSVALGTDLTALTTKVNGLVAIINDAGADDGDKILNKLNEVFAFLADISSDDKLKALLDGKADDATTLAGYGITDAKIDDGVITLGTQTITPLTQHQSLAAYATTEAMNTALSPKADKDYVDTELDKKINSTDITSITNAEIDAMITV